MITVELKNGSIKEYEIETSIADIVKTISAGFLKSACCAKINDKICDLRTKIISNCKLEILNFDDEGGRKTYWHTASHVLAQAIMRMYPDAKLAIGPSIDSGFYYDFDLKESLSHSDLENIENEMKKIIKEDIPIERFELNPLEASQMMKEKDQPYKVELINEHVSKGENISFYKQGDFVDLCTGPHLMSTGKLKAIKLTNCTGAYWRGDAKGKMLQRIYGIAFPKSNELKNYLNEVEDAKKRDHNKIGRDLKYFTTTDYIGQGLPIIMPNGARVLQLLQRFVEDEEQKRGYLITKTPFIAKSDLYKISGHWDHYRDDMFILGNENTNDEIFALRPMTCPFQFQVYLSEQRSYRDLPMRLSETSTLFRNESSGEMHGLIRVRQFTISEGHIACRADQLKEEFTQCVELANYMLKTLGLENGVFYRLSKWDENNKEKYIGDHQDWESSQNRMRDILDSIGIKYIEADGEAAFYGPKLDIQTKNVHGKEDTLITIQIDFQLAERFGMVYIDSDGKKKYPYVIHRTSLGCYERTLAMLLEKYAGALPIWLMPEQVRILPISEKFYEYAHMIKRTLENRKIRVSIDDRNEKIGYKIRESQLQKTPYMLIVGEKESTSEQVSVRNRKNGDMGSMTINKFLEIALTQIENKSKE